MSRALALAAFALGTLAPTANAQTSAPAPKPTRTGYADVNGLHMYYEIHGRKTSAPPLVLLHGGGSTIGTNFSRVIPLFTPTREVIAVELQAHGHTKDIDRPFTFENTADDVAAMLAQMHVAKADVLGFSNGGTTALQIAIRHPAVVNRLIIASANYSRAGMQDWFFPMMEKGTFADMPQQFKDAYLKINPSQDGVYRMWERDAKRMVGFKDIPDSLIHAIQAPTLVVVGDKDVVRVEHALDLSKLMPHAQLAVFPGGHGEYLGEITFPKVDARLPKAFVGVVDAFLLAADLK